MFTHANVHMANALRFFKFKPTQVRFRSTTMVLGCLSGFIEREHFQNVINGKQQNMVGFSASIPVLPCNHVTIKTTSQHGAFVHFFLVLQKLISQNRH